MHPRHFAACQAAVASACGSRRDAEPGRAQRIAPATARIFVVADGVGGGAMAPHGQ